MFTDSCRHFVNFAFPERRVRLGRFRYQRVSRLMDAYERWMSAIPKLDGEKSAFVDQALQELTRFGFSETMNALSQPVSRLEKQHVFILPYRQELKRATPAQQQQVLVYLGRALRACCEKSVLTVVCFDHPAHEVVHVPKWVVQGLQNLENSLSVRLQWQPEAGSLFDLLSSPDAQVTLPSHVMLPEVLVQQLMTAIPTHVYRIPFALDTHERLDPLYDGPPSRKRHFLYFLLTQGLQWKDPFTEQRKSVSHTLFAWLPVFQRYREHRESRWFCLNFGYWRKYNVLPFIPSARKNIILLKNMEDIERYDVNEHDQVLTWGMRYVAEIRSYCREMGLTLWQVEDGFLRSVGLGSDLIYAKSLCFDKQGIYFDASRQNDLEEMLNTRDFSPFEVERAQYLIQRVRQQRLTKYNLPESQGCPILASVKEASEAGRKIIFVPMQVYNDESIIHGCPGQMKGYDELLQAVRDQYPDALIMVKIHPDVAVGNRQETPHFKRIQSLADISLSEGSILQCIEVTDEVHTLTSLAGFEALLHGKKVVTYGNPFYGGWGLTEDHGDFSRRHRTLTLDQLATGVLLNYAQYYSTRYKSPAPPEFIVDELEVDRSENPRSAPNLLKLRRNLFRQFKKKQKQF